MVTFFVCVGLAFVLGFALAQVGLWVRFARIEAELRGLQMATHELSVMHGTRQIPAEWVEMQVADLLNRQFY